MSTRRFGRSIGRAGVAGLAMSAALLAAPGAEASAVSFIPDPVAFADVRLGESETLPVSVIIPAGYTLVRLFGTGSAKGFGLLGTPSCSSITGGEFECVSDYRFAPTELGLVTAVLTVKARNADGAVYQTADDVSGTGVAAVPEPSTWAMLGLGFAGLGLAGARRARCGTISEA